MTLLEKFDSTDFISLVCKYVYLVKRSDQYDVTFDTETTQNSGRLWLKTQKYNVASGP